MQHAGHAEVLHVDEAPRHFVGNVDPRHRLAHHFVVLRILAGGGFGMIELQRERFAPDQLAIAHPFAAGADDAIDNPEVLRLGVQAFGRLLEQRSPGGRRGVTQLHAADLDRQAAPGGALVGRERSVALDELDPVERHVEFVRDDLRQCSCDAGPEIDFAAIDRHHAAGIDREKRVDLGDREGLGPLGERLAGSTGEREADDQGAAALEHVASRSVNRHGSPPSRTGRAHHRLDDAGMSAAAA